MRQALVSAARWLAWARVLPRASVLVFCVVVLAAVQTVLGVLGAATEVRLAAALFVAAAAAASELDKLHARRREQQEAELQAQQAREAAEAEWLRQAQNCLRVWPAPRADEVDPYVLGVVPSPLADRYAQAGERLPPYVDRDRDALARDRLRARGLLLLIGAPASGVTRTAYEVACGGPTRRVVLAPQAPQGLHRALADLDVLSRLEPPVRLLLWLDRVDTFARGGLTAKMLRRCRKQSPGLWVVATISTTRYATWDTEESDVAAEFGEPITLVRLPAANELTRAQAAYPEVDFSEGIAAAFTAARALLVRLRAGDGDCPYEPPGGDCSVARAGVAVAIGWAGTGTPRPLPVVLLSGLVQLRLGRAKGLDPRHLARAVEWACAPTPQGARLLRHPAQDQSGETVQAHREVAEIGAAEERPSLVVWVVALAEAVTACDSDAIGRVGFQAHVAGAAVVATAAWANIVALDEPGAGWLQRAATFSRTRGEPRAEIRPRQRLLKLSEREYGPDHVVVAATLNNLGTTCNNAGQPALARELLERALRIFERECGPDHVDVARTVSNLGTTWIDLGQPTLARELFERALRIEEREYGPDHVDVARTLANLGAAWHGLGQPALARELFERALRIFEREYGPDCIEVASSLNNLGMTWIDLGPPARAHEPLERTLRIFEREYGPGADVARTLVARTLTNLGRAWIELGQPALARELFERELWMVEREYGPDHVELTRSLNNLGMTWNVLGQPAKARPLLKRALDILERAYGPDHVDVARTLNNLGQARIGLEQPDKARELFERALRIKEHEYGPAHFEVAGTLTNLGAAWRALGQPDKARELFERALRILYACFPSGHPDRDLVARNLRSVAPDLVVLDDGRVASRAGDSPSATS
jgi:tetratricopeptide (TPR) repeat protein